MTKETEAEREARELKMMEEAGGPAEFVSAWREMWAHPEDWTEAMKAAHVRRKTAVDACMTALAELDDRDRAVVKDRLRDLWDVEEGTLDPSEVSEW
jgi:hypothetical protein